MTTLQLTQREQDELEIVEQQVRYTSDLIRGYKEVQEQVENLIKKWDGKKYNKRFQTSLSEISDILHVTVSDTGRFEMYLCNYGARGYSNRNGSYSYVVSDKVYITTQPSNYEDGYKCIIHADAILEQVKRFVEGKELDLESAKKDLRNIHIVLNEYKAIKQRMEYFKKDTTWLVREVFHLDF